MLRARVAFPRVGAWTAELDVDTDKPGAFDAGVVLDFSGALELCGTKISGGLVPGRAQLTLVGGKGGLTKQLGARAYQGVPAKIPVVDVLTEAGEAMSPTSDVTALNMLLPKWVRPAGPAGVALTAVVESFAGAWRVMPDGSVWVGAEAWPSADTTGYQLLRDKPDLRYLELGGEVATLRPGQTFRGKRVSYVELELEPGKFRTRAWYDRAGSGLDGLASVLRQWFKRLDYYALYPALVVAQNEDGSLEVRPDDSRLPGMSRVPIRYGIPGVSVKVPTRSKVLVGFEGGDPRRPVASLWQAGQTPMEITLTASSKIKVVAPNVELGEGENTAPVARVGDLVDVVMGATPIAITGTVAGAPLAGTFIATSPFTGIIGTGSQKVKAA